MGAQHWSDDELAALRELYPRGKWKDIGAALPLRTPAAVKCQATFLSIKRGKRAFWTGAEQDALRKLWPKAPKDAIEAALPRHTYSSIGRMASTMGLRRDPARKQARYRIIRELRDERRRRGIKQEYVARAVGTHRVQIAKWERGETVPRLASFFDWVEASGYRLKLERVV